MTWLDILAPYCGETIPHTTCPDRPHHWHMCEATPGHEEGQTEHHVCGCGHGWTTQPKVTR
jgi:hypothetical protein